MNTVIALLSLCVFGYIVYRGVQNFRKKRGTPPVIVFPRDPDANDGK